MKNSKLWLALAILGMSASPAFAQNTISTVAGNGSHGIPTDGGIASTSPLTGPVEVEVIPGGGYYIGDTGAIRKVDGSGVITTIYVAGSTFDQIDGLVLAADGTLYFSEEGANLVRKRAPNGTVTTVAGTGATGSSGDGGPATAATLHWPSAIALDPSGNLYISEYGGCRVRKVDAAGIISTVLGTGVCASGGDGGPATSAQVNLPWGVRFDNTTGSILVSDHGGNRIRRIAPNGIVTTYAGNGTNASSGDGGQAVAASLAGPVNMDVDAAGNLYVAEFFGHKIRRIAPNGVITTVAGNGANGATGDGGQALNAAIGYPYTFATADGGYYIAQRNFDRVRFVADSTIQPQEPEPEEPEPTTTCQEAGYTGTKLTWCQNVCEKGYTGAVLNSWIHRWVSRYRDLPYCAVEDEEPEEELPPQND